MEQAAEEAASVTCCFSMRCCIQLYSGDAVKAQGVSSKLDIRFSLGQYSQCLPHERTHVVLDLLHRSEGFAIEMILAALLGDNV